MAQNGLLLPPGLIQPIPLGFRSDAYHVIAFLVGHPEYEAVEAMVGVRESGRFSIRAILTRHDQTQIDHVNDDTILASMRGAAREICQREIAFAIEDRGGKNRIHLAFDSFRGEDVALDLTTIGPAGAQGAGLIDPGRHSPRSSLPVMYRRASTIAGPESRLSIGGADYAIPVEIERGSFVALRAFFTAGFDMGVIRAGSRRFESLRALGRPRPGDEWTFAVDGQALAYRVAAEGDLLRIVRTGERVLARLHGDRLALIEIEMTDGDRAMTLAFDSGRFALSMSDAPNLVTGACETIGSTLQLKPGLPDWAGSRTVTVNCRRDGEAIAVETTIGS